MEEGGWIATVEKRWEEIRKALSSLWNLGACLVVRKGILQLRDGKLGLFGQLAQS